jgi:hypothetical protein
VRETSESDAKTRATGETDVARPVIRSIVVARKAVID